MPRPTGQLEQEAEQARTDLSATLDALRARLTPGQLLDDFMDSARDGSAGRFVQNLGRNVQENPLPVALVGLGLAWTMISTVASRRDGGFERARATTESGYFGPDTIENGVGAGVDSLTEATGHPTTRFGDNVTRKVRKAGRAVEDIREGVADAAAGATQSLSFAGSATAARATDLYRRTAHAGIQAKDRITGQASELTERVSTASRGLVDFCKEQPVVLVGLGLAIGAAIGALLPASRTEDRLFGQASKRIKEQAGDMAERAYDTGEEAVSKAVDQAASAASEALQGMGSESAIRPASSGSSAPPLQDDESTSLVPSENQGSSPDRDKTITAAGDRRD
jgi:ElaB/YqjD/DUF883 family membrane-anchored ribosome-binding protein